LAEPALCRGVSDRSAILRAQLFLGTVLVPFSLIYGNCLSGVATPPEWLLVLFFCLYNVAFLGQMPANNSLYMKLVGSRRYGVYQALLEWIRSCGRLSAGYLIGEAYGRFGDAALWYITLAVWLTEFLPLLLNWSRLPE